MLKEFATATAAGAMALTVAFSTPALAGVPESKDPIILTIHDWTGQYITTHIMGRVLEELGYNIKYQQADYIAQFAGLESGDLHIAMEMWETTGKQAMDESLATGNTVDLGETGMDAKEEWWYPIYMKEKCPGLPDWKALNDCAEAFSTPETHPKGRYLGGPVTWAGFDDERAEALGLDFEVVHAGTDAALFAELQSAYEREAPFLGWVYAPHWAPFKFKGEWVEFPEYTDACYEDASWGSNKRHAVRLRQAVRLDQEGRLEGGRGEVGLRLPGGAQLPHRQRHDGRLDRRGRSRRQVGRRRRRGLDQDQRGNLAEVGRLRRLGGRVFRSCAAGPAMVLRRVSL